MSKRLDLLTATAYHLQSFSERASVWGSLGGSPVVKRSFPHYDFWLITDNGGEFNVERMNSPETMRSISYVSHGLHIDPATMAYRVNRAMRGEAIDYDFRFSDEDIGVLDAQIVGKRAGVPTFSAEAT